jgi:L-threonylcarbamoyladenylate synthase
VIGDDAHTGVEVLGVPRDGAEYAHDLYRMLRDADARGLDRVIAVTPDPTGLGAAVADRLRRAAGSR